MVSCLWFYPFCYPFAILCNCPYSYSIAFFMVLSSGFNGCPYDFNTCYPLVSIHAVNTWFYPFDGYAIAILLLSFGSVHAIACMVTLCYPISLYSLYPMHCPMVLPISFCPLLLLHCSRYGFLPLLASLCELFALILHLLFHVGFQYGFTVTLSLSGLWFLSIHVYVHMCG